MPVAEGSMSDYRLALVILMMRKIKNAKEVIAKPVGTTTVLAKINPSVIDRHPRK
jgi:hypothetical protein